MFIGLRNLFKTFLSQIEADLITFNDFPMSLFALLIDRPKREIFQKYKKIIAEQINEKNKKAYFLKSKL